LTEEERDPGSEEFESRLNAAFATLRPRAGFDDELRARLRPKGGWRLRLREAWQRFNEPRLVPAFGAIAALLIVALLAFFFVGLHSGGRSMSPSSNSAGQMGAAAPRSAYFGALPAPALDVAPATAAPGPPPSVIPYTGPANLHWTGTLPEVPTTAPVLRFQPPSGSAVASLGAAAGPGSFNADTSAPEPRYTIEAGSRPAGGTAPSAELARSAADAFLSAKSLTPGWPNEVVVVREPSGAADVFYYRNFEVPGMGPAQEVDRYGNRTGIRVLVGPDNSVFHVDGPIPVVLATASYTLRQAQSMVSAALASAPSAQQPAGGVTPEVDLGQARLVYIATAAGGLGFYEPALLFTGTFLVQNQLYEKRVLVPAVDPSQLRP
jgi:hypothetical protein